MPSLDTACRAAAAHYALYCQLAGYAEVPDALDVPALVVVPTSCRYGRGRGATVDDVWQWELWLLLARVDGRVDQQQLRRYVDGTDPRGVPMATARGQSIRGDAYGLTNCKARLIGVDSLGARFTAAGLSHLGAVLRAEVTLPAVLDDQQPPL